MGPTVADGVRKKQIRLRRPSGLFTVAWAPYTQFRTLFFRGPIRQWDGAERKLAAAATAAAAAATNTAIAVAATAAAAAAAAAACPSAVS